MREPVIIGPCTLYHADCLEVLPTLESSSIDMIFTDPPYGHNNNNGDLIHRWEAALGLPPTSLDSSAARPIANDGEEATEYFTNMVIEAKRILHPSGSCCCCCCGGGGGPDPMFARWSLILDQYLNFKQMVVWDKGPMGMGWHYRRSYETVLVAHKGQQCRWYDESNAIENIIRSKRAKKIIPTQDNHPTEKPVSLTTYFTDLHSKPGDTVLDPFMGSGSTGIGCIRTGRKFIGIEIDEKYFNVAVNRITKELQQGRLL